MKQYKVSKNLESEPRISGYKPQYYYILFIIQVVYVLVFFVYLLMVIADGSASSYVQFILGNILLTGALLFLRKYFKKRSGKSKYEDFKKERTLLSNKDILKEI